MPEDLIFKLSPTQSAFVKSEAEVVMLMGPMGEGKCLKKGTPVMMADGSVRAVEDVRVGDQLMGPDGMPRNVLSLGHGHGPMFTVVPKRGEPFTANGDHILSLKRTHTKNTKRGKPYNDLSAGQICNVSILDYLNTSKTFKATHNLYRVPIDFPKQAVSLDPYFLGVWLGDGDSHRAGITTPDPEIAEYMIGVAAQMGVGVRVEKGAASGAATKYHFSAGNNGGTNPIMSILHQYRLVNNKHVPPEYLHNSTEVRLRVLAGLVDSDGWRNQHATAVNFIFKSKQLVDDIVYLCRSLGFAAFPYKTSKAIRDIGFKGEYYRFSVSGDLSDVPVLLDRKRCRPRKCQGGRWARAQDPLVTGIREIIAEGDGEYFGFNLDGDHLYLLGDFTVTHNTYGAVPGLMAHAVRCGCPIRGALVRDTHQNIKISTVPDIKQMLGSRVSFHDDDKKMVIHSTPRVEMDLFGIDDPASLSKLQGPQYAIIWLEEPAPIIEKANAGLPRDVFDMALARAARQSGTRMRVQITQNPADEDHWTEELANGPEVLAEDPISGFQICKEVFRIPYGENQNLNPQARAANIAAFRGDPGKYARYVEGRAAPVMQGRKVTPEYAATRHYADTVLEVVDGCPGVRGWDAWQNPCCIIGQLVPPGRLIIHEVLRGENIAVKELIEQQVAPILQTPKYRDRIEEWRDIGDPSMRTPDQSSTQQSAARMVEDLLGGRFEPGPTRWQARIQPLKSALVGGCTDGGPKILISRSAYYLHRTLNGGWHWKTDNSGNVVGASPVKDMYSHPGDALSYLVSVMFPYGKAPGRYPKSIPQDVAMRRAMGYRGGNYSRRRMAVG